jgi:dienelactone hydrolase
MSAYPAEVERKVRTWKDMMCSHRRQSLISGILLLLSCLIPVVTSALDDSPTTPDTVWAGFDPRHEPLEIKILKRWTEHGAHYTEFTFTGMTHEGSKVRVYAISSAPDGKKKLPGVLHIHGGGQTVNPAWLRFWNERGYAALTFNWGGKWPGRDKFADWGTLTQGNHRDAGQMVMATKPSVRESSWYLWTRISRRAFTCLERMDEVDPDRLGIFGVSMGGTIVWPFAAMDTRVKAACAIYGVGWNTYPDEVGSRDPNADNPDVKTWRGAMEPESYARLVRCPVLFLDATNDQHGKMDWAFKTLTLVPADVRWAFTPRYRHHIDAEQGINLPLWMDAYLNGGERFPGSPAAEVRLSEDGVPRLSLKPTASRPIKRVEMYYAVANGNPKNRYWRTVTGQPNAGKWSARLPVLDPKQPLFAFGNVTYESSVCLSSNLVTVIPAEMGEARATDTRSPVIDDLSEGLDAWVTRSPATDPIPPVPSLLRTSAGPDGKTGFTTTTAIPIMTHKVGDPKWRGPDGSSLQFEVYVRAPRVLKVIMHEDEFGTRWTQYHKELRLTPTEGWQTLTLATDEFLTDKGERLKSWRAVDMLELESQGGPGAEPVFRTFRWVEPPPK